MDGFGGGGAEKNSIKAQEGDWFYAQQPSGAAILAQSASSDLVSVYRVHVMQGRFHGPNFRSLPPDGPQKQRQRRLYGPLKSQSDISPSNITVYIGASRAPPSPPRARPAVRPSVKVIALLLANRDKRNDLRPSADRCLMAHRVFHA